LAADPSIVGGVGCSAGISRVGPPARDIEGRTGFRSDLEAPETGAGAIFVSTPESEIGRGRFPVSALCFRIRQLRCPNSTARGFLAFRAARAIPSASSVVLIRFHSLVGGSEGLVKEKVSLNKFGLCYSAFPPRPRSVTFMKPSASASRIAGAIAP